MTKKTAKKKGSIMSEKDFWEFLNASLRKGRISQVSGTTDSVDEELQAVGDFVGSHALLPKDYDKIPKAKITEMGKLLLEKETTFKAKEAIMIILAHHGSNEALTALKAYKRNPDRELRIFAELALDECEMWNEP